MSDKNYIKCFQGHSKLDMVMSWCKQCRVYQLELVLILTCQGLQIDSRTKQSVLVPKGEIYLEHMG